MVAIPGGTFLMGSPAEEPHRKPDEGPQHKVSISPFWISETEIPWELYTAFMENGRPRAKDGQLLEEQPDDELWTPSRSLPPLRRHEPGHGPRL
ncbi:hypothetical protein C1I94_06010 [Akkermansia muciniphila]|uniref:formylglycine-generating enzyme family protein n=1 Tax=Akkermansia muciniphila TaxID=239935 RepID=UPI000FE15F64|nr:SUMF1/EgtB/PvdO family nonheme iron enzyme [Akkermansia muciniphila]QAA41201.1 hypothetical protein C1I94_06010 [Akkermansia muciniphila]